MEWKISPSILLKCTLFALVLSLLPACQSAIWEEVNNQTLGIKDIQPGMTRAEAETLNSLEQIDPYPLYVMDYQAEYDPVGYRLEPYYTDLQVESTWGCSLFAVFADPERMYFGRNFDWEFSPGLLLFTYPPDGYASVSMVDIDYLGFGDDLAFGLTDLPLSEREGLLDAPYLPFDGMNQAGLAVGMAAVPDGGMVDDPSKETIDSLMVIRKILDDAATVDEAVGIIEEYNIDMGSGPPLHYLIAERSGRSVLVEFYQGEMVVIPNSYPWQQATNFLLSEISPDLSANCWRFDWITERLEEKGGILSGDEAMNLLEDVAQDSTQWSVIYGFGEGEVEIVMGGNYRDVYSLSLSP